MKKILGLCFTFIFVAILMACTGNDSGETTIKFTNFSGVGHEDTLDEMIAEFEALNPNINVEPEIIGFEDYFTQLATKVAGNQAPDVFELNIEYFRSYANKGALVELDTDSLDLDEIHSTTLEAFQVEGKQYGLPTKFSNVVLVYNKDLFDQAEIPYPNAIWTWTEELVAAQAISDLGDDIFGVIRPIQTWEFYKTVAQNGGSMMNEDQTEFTLNSSENVEALEMMIARMNETNVTPTAEQLGGMGDWDLFLAGKLGMIVTGIWAFDYFSQNAEFEWDIAVEPGIEEKATHFFSDAVVVSSSSEQQEAAAKFAAFFAGSEEAALLRANANWDLPVALTDEVVEAYKAITPPDNRQAVFDSLNYLVMPPSLENFGEVADDLQHFLDLAIAEELTAQEALDQAQELISNKDY